jgi:hypothetical protein
MRKYLCYMATWLIGASNFLFWYNIASVPELKVFSGVGVSVCLIAAVVNALLASEE